MICPVDTKTLSTMRIGSTAHSLICIKNKLDIQNIIMQLRASNDRFHIIGGGSNTVFGDNLDTLKLLKIEIPGIDVIKSTDSYNIIKVGSGVVWDTFVEYACLAQLSGVEALSYIPGTVGACPVQNIGAYGQEAKDTIQSAEVYDTETNEWKIFNKSQCEFGYRSSIFKKYPNKYIITSVIFKLEKNSTPSIPAYKDVTAYFALSSVTNPSPIQIREAIISIRKRKLPDPNITPNCGSFFKNPIISHKLMSEIKNEFPNAPFFKSGEGYKVPASFLIDCVGFKGKTISNMVVYSQNAVVLTNPNNATFKDIVEAKSIIVKRVHEKFGVILEPEVNIVI